MADDRTLEGHVKTYSSLINLFKWGTIAVALLAALVIWLISH